MSLIKKRVAELEARSPAAIPVWHRFILEPGEKLEDAIAAYCADQIGPHDNVITVQIVYPPVRQTDDNPEIARL